MDDTSRFFNSEVIWVLVLMALLVAAGIFMVSELLPPILNSLTSEKTLAQLGELR